MAELNHLTAARITYAIGENSYAIDRATLQSWLVQGEDGTYTISQDEAAAFVRHMAYETDTFGLAHTFKTSLGATINLNAGGDYGWCIDKEETTQALLQAIEDETQEISIRFTFIRQMTVRRMISEIHTSRCAFPSRKCGATRMAFW